MSEQRGPGWTLDTLKVLMDERDRRYSEISEAKEKAVEAALAAASKAVDVAEKNAEKWRENANEWRAAMTDRESKFMQKSMGIVLGGLTSLAILLAVAEKFVG